MMLRQYFYAGETNRCIYISHMWLGHTYYSKRRYQLLYTETNGLRSDFLELVRQAKPPRGGPATNWVGKPKGERSGAANWSQPFRLETNRTSSAAASVSNSDSGPYSDMRASGDPRFSAEEQRIVSAARTYLEKSRRKPLDARYRVERPKEGYEVFAMFVGGYENGRPLYYPGGHGIVILRPDGSVVRYLPGQ